MKVAGEEWTNVASKINQHAAKANDLWSAHVAGAKGFKA